MNRPVGSRAILEVISTGLGDALDRGVEKKRRGYDDSYISGFYSWNGGVFQRNTALEE